MDLKSEYDNNLKEQVDKRFDFLDAIPVALSVLDMDSMSIVKCNSIFADKLKINKNTVFSLSDMLIFTDKDLQKIKDADSFLMIVKSTEKEPFVFDVHCSKYSLEGKEFLLLSNFDLLKDYLPEKMILDTALPCGSSSDIFENVFNQLPIFACVLTFNKKEVLFANPACKRFFGAEIERSNSISFFSETEEPELINHKSGTVEFETIIRSKWYKLSACYMNWNGERSLLILGKDITKLKKLEDRLLVKATTDSLTKVYNRETAIDYINDFIHGTKERFVFTASYIELDNIKEVISQFGINEGDSYIINMVEILKSTIRNTDILARMYTGEFIILFPNCVSAVVENIMTTIKNNIDIINTDLKDYKYSINYGIFEIATDNSMEATEIIKELSERVTK